MSRTILITGGTGKIGRILVAHFLAKGDYVVFTGRSADTLATIFDAHAADVGRLSGLVADFTAEGSAKELADVLTEKELTVEGLINNARCREFLRMDKDGKVSRADFMGELLVDVVAPYELTMALALHPTSRLRHVVNIGSQYGSVAANPALYTDPAHQSPLHYSVAKAALGHLTRELAVRLAKSGIQVNCLAFGGIDGRVDDDFKRRYAALAPLGRMLRDDEVAGPVEFLLSKSCSGMTGQVVAVDGGWTIW